MAGLGTGVWPWASSCRNLSLRASYPLTKEKICRCSEWTFCHEEKYEQPQEHAQTLKHTTSCRSGRNISLHQDSACVVSVCGGSLEVRAQGKLGLKHQLAVLLQ